MDGGGLRKNGGDLRGTEEASEKQRSEKKTEEA